MVSAIGSSSYFSTANAGKSIAGLQAQLDRYQKELSDCVNCDSAKTREGKENIQDVSGKIGEIKARIEAATLAKPDAQTGASGARSGASENWRGQASDRQNNTVFGAGLSFSALGNHLDVFA